MVKKIFASDPSYKEMAARYTKTDALLALGMYILVMAGLLLMGIIQAKTGMYLGVLNSVITMTACIVIVLARKQKLSTIGLTPDRLRKSLILGLVVGVFLSLLDLIPAIQAGRKFTSDGLVYNLFYYLVIIGLQEEMLFRGFIQTRLYGAIKSDVLAVIVGAVMFATMHIPFQMFNRGTGNLFEFLADNYFWILLTFMWHFVFNFLYRKFNSIAAPTIAHWLMNLGGNLLY